jgi:hypothetical protein
MSGQVRLWPKEFGRAGWNLIGDRNDRSCYESSSAVHPAGRWARAIMGRVDDYLEQVRQVDAMRCGGSVQSQLRDLTQEP